MKRVLLVYPKSGISGVLVKHMPLSLIYAAAEVIKKSFAVDIVDVRLNPGGWKDSFAAKITPDTIILGISVMTGVPVKNAAEITRWVKEKYPQVKLIWGGPHATFNAREILENYNVDYAVTGYGARPLAQIASYLRGDEDAPSPDRIPGLCYRQNNNVILNSPEAKFEVINFRDIPYRLVETEMNRYGQLESGERIFPLYSVMGCPYQCAFCSSPAQYRHMEKKYELIPVAEVVDHIEYVKEKYGATYIYFIDDDSFVDLHHVEAIIDELRRRNIKIKLGFRGARVNEIKKMSGDYLVKLAEAGTDMMHVGAESGSSRILKLLGKNFAVEDTIEVNQKLARIPKINIGYNWIVGLPGETLDDLHETRKLILRLINDNPSALIFIPNKYRPLPGTELYALAIKYGYREPRKIGDWLSLEAEGSFSPCWYSRETAAMINMLQVTSYFIDSKIFKVKTGFTIQLLVIKLLAYLYRPIARFRLQHGNTSFLIEDKIFRWLAFFYHL